MNQLSKVTPKAWRAEWYLVLVALGLGFAFWPSSDRSSVTRAVQEEARECGGVELVSRGRGLDERHTPLSIGAMPIQSIAVGQRVLGEDPLIDDAERAGWVEPQWDQWLQISLVMRKDTGDELRIELLRPEEWLTERWQFIASRPEGWCVTALDVERRCDCWAYTATGVMWNALAGLSSGDGRVTALELAATGYELVGLTLELDLHEIGAVGEAVVLDIQPTPPVRLGAGRVVTGKFSHKSSDVIDLVLAGSDQESETIGTTSHHPFWSEDRRDYVQAGSLKEGERVLTFAGDTKRVVSKLARPGPQPVYNLEVHGEHVYHVGKDGVLVHNEYTKDFGGGVSYRDSLDEFGAPKGLETPEMKRYREYWEGKGDFQHSNQSAPFSIKKSYHPDGNVKTVTTYDQNGNAYRQYVVSERGHDFHQHRYEVNTTKPNPNRKSIDSNAPRRLPGERVND